MRTIEASIQPQNTFPVQDLSEGNADILELILPNQDVRDEYSARILNNAGMGLISSQLLSGLERKTLTQNSHEAL